MIYLFVRSVNRPAPDPAMAMAFPKNSGWHRPPAAQDCGPRLRMMAVAGGGPDPARGLERGEEDESIGDDGPKCPRVGPSMGPFIAGTP